MWYSIVNYLANRSIWDNVFVTILVGMPLSYWLAKVVHRLVAFHQAKIAAVKDIGSLKRITTLSDNLHTALREINWVMEEPPILMGGEEQWEAMINLVRIRDVVRKKLTERFDDEAMSMGFAKRPDLKGDQWLEVQAKVFKDPATKALVKGWLDDVQSLEPDFVRIIGLLPRNRTLDRWEKRPVLRIIVPLFDVLRRRKERWRRFRDYMDGKTDHL